MNPSRIRLLGGKFLITQGSCHLPQWNLRRNETSTNGIPQGSPVSPMLAAFYTTELIEIFKPTTISNNNQSDEYSPLSPTQINMIMFIDDGKIYVSSKALEMNVILIKLAYQEVERWLTSAGLSADTDKREVMHYSH